MEQTASKPIHVTQFSRAWICLHVAVDDVLLCVMLTVDSLQLTIQIDLMPAWTFFSKNWTASYFGNTRYPETFCRCNSFIHPVLLVLLQGPTTSFRSLALLPQKQRSNLRFLDVRYVTWHRGNRLQPAVL